MRSVYIHIPFCSSICSYCDFCKFLHDEIWADEYLSHLEKEINKYYDNDEVRTIYIGGGTPSTSNSDYWDGEIDWYAPAEIADQIYVSSSTRKITKY